MRPRGFQREFSPKAMVGVTVSDDLIPAVLLQFALCGDTLRVSCPILPLYPVANLIFPSISARNLNSTCDQLCQIPSYCRWKYPPPIPFLLVGSCYIPPPTAYYVFMSPQDSPDCPLLHQVLVVTDFRTLQECQP